VEQPSIHSAQLNLNLLQASQTSIRGEEWCASGTTEHPPAAVV